MLAGQPSKVTGVLARTIGWIALVGGLTSALTFYMVFHWLFPEGPLGLVVALPIATVSAMVFAVTQVSGKKLMEHGTNVAQTTREQAIFALAQKLNGRVRVVDVSRALGTNDRDADATLTVMAKKFDEQMSVDFDDQGTLVYVFPHIDLEYRTRIADPRTRVVTTDDAIQHNFEEFVANESKRAQERH
jgi:hypothetical protein